MTEEKADKKLTEKAKGDFFYFDIADDGNQKLQEKEQSKQMEHISGAIREMTKVDY